MCSLTLFLSCFHKHSTTANHLSRWRPLCHIAGTSHLKILWRRSRPSDWTRWCGFAALPCHRALEARKHGAWPCLTCKKLSHSSTDISFPSGVWLDAWLFNHRWASNLLESSDELQMKYWLTESSHEFPTNWGIWTSVNSWSPSPWALPLPLLCWKPSVYYLPLMRPLSHWHALGASRPVQRS